MMGKGAKQGKGEEGGVCLYRARSKCRGLSKDKKGERVKLRQEEGEGPLSVLAVEDLLLSEGKKGALLKEKKKKR